MLFARLLVTRELGEKYRRLDLVFILFRFFISTIFPDSGGPVVLPPLSCDLLSDRFVFRFSLSCFLAFRSATPCRIRVPRARSSFASFSVLFTVETAWEEESARRKIVSGVQKADARGRRLYLAVKSPDGDRCIPLVASDLSFPDGTDIRIPSRLLSDKRERAGCQNWPVTRR